jgi:GTP-binding protein
MEEVARATPLVEFAPVLKASALTGAGVGKLFPAITAVYRQYASSFATRGLNLLLREAIAAHPPPLVRGRRLKFFYTTQCPLTWLS